MNVSEEFAVIRKQFQKLHAELDQYMLFMDVCHWPDDKTQSESAAEHCKVPFELLGLMHIPIVHPKHHQYLFKEDPLALFNEFAAASSDELNRRQAQYQIVGFPDADQRPTRRLKVAYFRCPNDTTRSVASRFRALAEQAGASLPSVVLDAIPMLFDTNSYVDRWLEFVFWQNPPSLKDLLHLNCTLNTHVYRIPCEDSARAITECGLDTTSPVFRPQKGQWPVWAGFPPTDPVRQPMKNENSDSSEVNQVLQTLLDEVISNRACVQRRTVELLIDYEGRLPIADLAKDEKVDWTLEEWSNNVSTLLSKLKKHLTPPWGFARNDNAIVVTFNENPVKK